MNVRTYPLHVTATCWMTADCGSAPFVVVETIHENVRFPTVSCEKHALKTLKELERGGTQRIRAFTSSERASLAREKEHSLWRG